MVEVSCVEGRGVVDVRLIAKVIRLSRQHAQLQDDYEIHVFRVRGLTFRSLSASLLLVNKSNLHWKEILVTHASQGSNIYRI